MSAIAIIRDEHRRMAAVLSCLKQLADDLALPDVHPDFAGFDAILGYLESFPARCHHPKEEQYLFARLDGRKPALSDALKRLREEHDSGERRLVDLERALERLRREPKGEVENFRRAVNDYVIFERNHMRLEESEILPQAEQLLTPKELAELESAFLGNDDPLFGPERQQKYRDLFSHVLAAVPQPHGFALPWRRDGGLS